MSNFRTRILGLAAMATAFVGVSYGQVVVCNTGTNIPAGATAPPAYTNATTAGISNLGTQVNPSLRAESQTELIAVYQFNCTVVASATGAPAAPAAASQTTGTVYITTNLPITSKAIPPTGNEATLILNGTGTVVNPGGVITCQVGAGTACQPLAGTVSGDQVTFALPTCTVGSVTCPIPDFPAVAVFEVTNVRVNASAAGAPQVAESGLLSYVVPNTTSGLITANLALPTANGPGYILKSLAPPSITVNNNYQTCLGNPTDNLSFTVGINQLIPDTFLGVGTATSLLPGSEAGQYVAGAVGTANADIINVTISNLPSSATVYVPQAIGPFGGANSFTLSIQGSTISTAVGAPANSVAFTPSSGTITIPYSVSVTGIGDQTTQTGATGVQVPVTVGFAANSAAAQGPITATYSYAPVVAALTGPASAVPQFVASTFTAVNGSIISNCQTTLLFPFVTNQLGFDTGFAIANTSVDNLGLGGKTIAAAQSGTCQLSFYGPTAPATATVADPQGSLAAGNVHTFQLSAIAAGYQGYVIANCPFVYARGFAFLTFGLTTNSGIAEGYLAEVLDTRNGTPTTTIGDTTSY